MIEALVWCPAGLLVDPSPAVGVFFNQQPHCLPIQFNRPTRGHFIHNMHTQTQRVSIEPMPRRGAWPGLAGLLLLFFKSPTARSFLAPPYHPPSRPPHASSTRLRAASGRHVQPPERTIPLPGPPEEWEGLPPERHAEFLRQVRWG